MASWLHQSLPKTWSVFGYWTTTLEIKLSSPLCTEVHLQGGLNDDLRSLTLPQSDNCVESYVEVRRFNDSGPLIERFCVDGPKTFTVGSTFI